MTKPKKRQFWSLSIKPFVPSPPSKPQKTVTEKKYIEVAFYRDPWYFPLSAIELPSNVTLNELVFKADADDITFYRVETSVRDNEHYEQQLERYKINYANYLVAKEEHKEELTAWEVWADEERKKREQKEIARAEKILKKYGKKIVEEE